MSRPTKATIDLSALRHNLAVVRSLACTKIMAVVKADAYGHGAVPVAQTLEQENVEAFAVACIEEAIELREGGIRAPILLLEGFYEASELALMARYNLHTVVQHTEQIALLERWSGPPFGAWLKIDTGMHRIGFLPSQFRAAYRRIKQCAAIKSVTLMSHFSCANCPQDSYTPQQLSTFAKATKGLAEEISLCNSAATFRWPEAHHHWVRPGIMLYGASPFPFPFPDTGTLEPVMTLSTRLLTIRHLPAGAAIGYGATWVTERPTRVGVLPVGYADGYPLATQPNTPVLIRGRRTRILGQVSMDMVSIDLTPVPDASLDDEVILWGKELPATEVARHTNTMAYEMFCHLKRVKKTYTESLSTRQPADNTQPVATVEPTPST